MAKRKVLDEDSPPILTARRSSRLTAAAPPSTALSAASGPKPSKPKKLKPNAPAEQSTFAPQSASAPIEISEQPLAAHIAVGGTLPADLILKNEDDEDVLVGNLAKAKRGFCLFSYPKANTGGCTTQACGFRDLYDQFEARGFEVYGISADKPIAQKNWKIAKQLQYGLLCDPDKRLLKLLGAVKGASTLRSHFVVDAEGILLQSSLAVKPATDPSNALAFVEGL